MPGAQHHRRKVPALRPGCLHTVAVHAPSSLCPSSPQATPAPLLQGSIRAYRDRNASTEHPGPTAAHTKALSPASASPPLAVLQLPAWLALLALNPKARPLSNSPGAAPSPSALPVSYTDIYRSLVYCSVSERQVWFKPTAGVSESDLAIMDQRRWVGARAGRWGRCPSPREPRELAVPGEATRLEVLSGLPCVRGELRQLCRARELGGLQVLSISPGDGSPGLRRALAGGCELESPRQGNPDGHGQGRSSKHVRVSPRQQGWGSEACAGLCSSGFAWCWQQASAARTQPWEAHPAPSPRRLQSQITKTARADRGGGVCSSKLPARGNTVAPKRAEAGKARGERSAGRGARCHAGLPSPALLCGDTWTSLLCNQLNLLPVFPPLLPPPPLTPVALRGLMKPPPALNSKNKAEFLLKILAPHRSQRTGSR